MEISKVSIEELLRRHNTLSIPFYQREYVWTENETKRLLEDITNSKTKEYYIGSIVFKNNLDNQIIIDGQQRLSTIWLILKSLSLKNEYLDHNSFLSIQKHLKYFSFQIANLKDGDVLNKIINDNHNISETDKSTNYYLNFLQIQKFFKMYSGRLNEFYNQFKKVIAAKVIVDENVDEHILFSQINSTGKKLSAFDLVKNFLFSKIASDSDEKILEKKLYFFNFVTKLNKPSDTKYKDEIIRHFISHKTFKLCNNSQEKIYKEFCYLLENNYSNNHAHLFDDFFQFALIYKYISDDYFDKYKFYSSLTFLTHSFKTYATLMVDIFLNNLTIDNFQVDLVITQEQEKKILDCLLILENYKIRREFCELKEKTITRFIPNLVGKINFTLKHFLLDNHESLNYNYCLFYIIYSHSNNSQFYKKGLPSYRMPLDEEFKINFKTKKIYIAGKFCKNFLIRLSSNKTKICFDNYTIEHIMPRDLSKWEKDGFDDNEEQVELKRDTIGNLTLTPYNSEYSNYLFVEKVKLMKEKEGFVLNNYFLNLTYWNLESIDQRANILFEQAMQIWNFDKVRIHLNEMNDSLNDFFIDKVNDSDLFIDPDEVIDEIYKNKSYFKKINIVTYQDIKDIIFNYIVDGLGHEENEFNVFEMKFDGWVSYSILAYLFDKNPPNKESISELEFDKIYLGLDDKISKLKKTIDDFVK